MGRRDDEEEQARRDNQLFVRAQAKALGLLPPKQDRRERDSHGIAHVTLKLSEMRTLPTPEEFQGALERAWAKADKMLREDIAAKGGIVDRLERVQLVNGDLEVRALFTMRRAGLLRRAD